MSTKKSSTSATDPLACPRCALRYPLDERFCGRCGMPLVYVGGRALEQPVTEAHGRARKINPAYTEGDLVKVGWARNQAEAELIQGFLLEEGVPSVLQRSRGFDVPDFLAAGPRDVMVPESGAQAAREVLQEADVAAPDAASASARPRPLRLAAAVAAGGLFAALVAWVLAQVVG